MRTDKQLPRAWSTWHPAEANICAGARSQHVEPDAGEAAVAHALLQQLPLHLVLAALAAIAASRQPGDSLVISSSPLPAVLLRHTAQLYVELTGAGSPWQQAAMASDCKTLPSWCDTVAGASSRDQSSGMWRVKAIPEQISGKSRQ